MDILTTSLRRTMAALICGAFALLSVSADARQHIGAGLTRDHATGTTTLCGMVENPDGTLSLEAEQSGCFDGMGDFTGRMAYTAYFDPSGTVTYLIGSGTFTLATGDTINLNVTIATFGAEYPMPFYGVLMVTGGTGKFAGAYGAMMISGEDGEEFSDNFSINCMVGTIALGRQ